MRRRFRQELTGHSLRAFPGILYGCKLMPYLDIWPVESDPGRFTLLIAGAEALVAASCAILGLCPWNAGSNKWEDCQFSTNIIS